jgi:hypothetical protein
VEAGVARNCNVVEKDLNERNCWIIGTVLPVAFGFTFDDLRLRGTEVTFDSAERVALDPSVAISVVVGDGNEDARFSVRSDT